MGGHLHRPSRGEPFGGPRSAGRVTNTGVAGWNPNHYLMEAEQELSRHPYDAVVVSVFLGNDVVCRRQDHIDAWQPAARRSLRWPRELGRREWIDAVAYPINDALERRSHLFTLLKGRGKFLLMRIGLSKHNLPPSLVVGGLDESCWNLTAELLQEIATEVRAAGTEPVFVLLPGTYQVNLEVSRRYAEAAGLDLTTVDADLPGRELGARLRAAGLDVVDATPPLREALAAGAEDLFGTVDTHLGPEGHRVVASVLFPKLLDRVSTTGEAP